MVKSLLAQRRLQFLCAETPGTFLHKPSQSADEKIRRISVFVNRSMEPIISNRITSEIPGAYQAPNLVMSEWCRKTAHSVAKPTIR
jgi:hypothetical protein